MAEELKQLEEKLWAAADKLRSESGLKSTQYSTPVLGLIFLRFASNKYDKFKDEIEAEFAKRLQSQNYVEYVPGPVIRFLKKNPIPYRQRIRYPTRYICFLTKYIQSCLFPDKYRIVIPRINP